MTAMDALLALEAECTRAGRSLLPIFFPGELLPEEMAKCEALKVAAAQEEEYARQRVQQRQTVAKIESWVAHAKTFERK